jgi:hypothetical protein
MNISRKEKSNLTDYIEALHVELEIRYETIEGLEKFKMRFGKHRKGNVERLDNLRSSIPLLKALIEDLEQVNTNMKMGVINQF